MTEITSASRAAAFDETSGADRKAWATTWLSLVGALAMTSCCILPLALISVGVTGVFIGKLTALYQYHWYFLAFATAALGYGFWKAYGPVPAEACADGTCERTMNRTLMRSILWFAAIVVVIATVFPYLAPSLLNPF